MNLTPHSFAIHGAFQKIKFHTDHVDSRITLSSLAVFFWLLNIVLDTGGHLALKAAAADRGSGLRRWKYMLSSFRLWLGIGCFAIEFGVWFALLSLVPLSLAVLIGSINIVA